MSKKPKPITNLVEFNNKETFIRLLDRATYIEKLINTILRIRQLFTNIEIINFLQNQEIDLTEIIRTHTELIYILYRSMFQSAYWEANCRKVDIDPSAYSYDKNLTKENQNIHEEIITHVHKILAHQDVEHSQRGVYPPITNERGDEFYATWNGFKYHADALKPHIELMKEAIKNTYFFKFKEELLLMGYNFP